MSRRSRKSLAPRALFGIIVIGGCSILNREGPDATCDDLDGGAVNACEEGIIATCSNGRVSWRVCEDKEDGAEGDETLKAADEICEADWQQEGRFRCQQSESLPSGTAGSGGTGNWAACGFSMEPVCADCVRDRCCSFAQACASNPECHSCATRPASSAPCVPEMVPTWDAFLDCLLANCSTECG